MKINVSRNAKEGDQNRIMIPGFFYKIDMFSTVKIKRNYTYRLSRSSLVGIRTLLWTSQYGVRIPIEATDFSDLGHIQPPNQLVPELLR